MNDQIYKAVCCRNEYDPLKLLAVCEPQFMAIRKIINETQRLYIKDNIDVKKALKQHNQFCDVLKRNGVELVSLSALKEYPEQVFTRDIGFTVGSTVFISVLQHDIRKGEERLLKEWLQHRHLPFHELTASIEGGDVIIDEEVVYVGISKRTSEAAAQELDNLLKGQLKKLPIDDCFLHLDCVFNILSKNEALIYSPAFAKEDLAWLGERYHLIEVTREEQFSLGTNILNLGNKKLISLPTNNRINDVLRKQGYIVEEVDFSEIIKSGGSFRCCSMPLLREAKS